MLLVRGIFMSDKRTEPDTYDRGIVPAETAARKEREGEAYKQVPDQDADESIDTTGGYSVDKEGLVNNFAIEPEMYVNEPGDLRERDEELQAEREEEYEEINDTNKDGELTMKEDKRGKGTGII
ncbi:hypothetical protein C7B61_20415 [filamentous cyanobacterium CCP1]|nr:hypothetical protein C7B76_08125 [filamentous cyanobacterium CCP2]PSB56619.1 hypothetical protein C7B61_20415 [filamentous cyanobacterium CCP1]